MIAAWRIVRKFVRNCGQSVEGGGDVRGGKESTQMPGTTIQQAQNAGYLKLVVALATRCQRVLLLDSLSRSLPLSLTLCRLLAQLKVE